MGQYYKCLSIAATIMISNKFPIIAEQVAIIFVTSLVTIATVLPIKKPLILPLIAYNSKTELTDALVFAELNFYSRAEEN